MDLSSHRILDPAVISMVISARAMDRARDLWVESERTSFNRGRCSRSRPTFLIRRGSPRRRGIPWPATSTFSGGIPRPAHADLGDIAHNLTDDPRIGLK